MRDRNMTDSNNNIWQTKLAARLHDPAEKALVLLRDPAGHEGGTSSALKRLLGFDEIKGETIGADSDVTNMLFTHGIPAPMYRRIQRADWWAAAADRPQWPMQELTITTKAGEKKTFKVANWAQVRWSKDPVLIHPLTGKKYTLPGGLSETDFHDIKKRSFNHIAKLLVELNAKNGGEQDWRLTLLTVWRFGSEVTEDKDNSRLGPLWHLLPADTRVPDHSIWDHLDLVSAFAGAFTGDPDGEASLLSLSIGPVQSFIASARKMDDLWAGSHLLARLSWEAMRVVCEKLGPDAILFPRLRGVPQVDLWLRDQCGLPRDLFKDCEWNKGGTDSNPLFSAALPNRFIAIVPRGQAKEIAESIESEVRIWLRNLGNKVVAQLLSEASYTDVDDVKTPYEQMTEQLEGFPEVHWASVPFSLIKPANKHKQTELDVAQLSDTMKPFFPGEGEPGFLGTPAWELLQKDMELIDEQGKKTVFFAPNPGVLYPAIYELAERTLAAAKSIHAFYQTRQEGWRCSISGETEWLTTNRKQLEKSYRRQKDTLWAKIAECRPAWAKEGEYLGAIPSIKRLWPTLFKEEVDRALGDANADKDIARFVVSTHTMALAHQLDRWLSKVDPNEKLPSLQNAESVALPRKLMLKHRNNRAIAVAKRLPGLLDAARDRNDEHELEQAQKIARSILGENIESYYSLILMDGDRMGLWLSGGDDYSISYRDSFHPQVQEGFDARAERQMILQQYSRQKRAISPNRHLAISGALNDFSLKVVRHVVEEEHLGRLIYAGGDDVFAIMPVADLLPAMQRLRMSYSGHDPEYKGGAHRSLILQNGFALLDGKIMRMMGTNATASCGAVIAHHQAPLSAVRRELAATEKRAKNEGGRDAFSITVIKRSGGALQFTEKWGEPVKLLVDMRDFLADEDVSRRAVYHTLEWLNEQDLPLPTGDGAMLQTLLTYQLTRQADEALKLRAPELAKRLVVMALNWEEERIKKLRNFLSMAEFLARETRTGSNNKQAKGGAA
jgi:CRISPR-associated protein Cmr2